MINRRVATLVLAAAAVAMMGSAVLAVGGDRIRPGYYRFVYRTETASLRAEVTTTEIIPLGNGQYSVVTTTEDRVRQDDIRLSFFGDAAQSIGLYMDRDESSPFDLSPLGALADQELMTDWTYSLADGWSLRTGGRVTIAGLPGVEGIFTHADRPAAIVRVVLADDLYIRQFLPFPLCVELEYQEATTTDPEDPRINRSFSGRVELMEYVHTPAEEGTL
jgi:hypothetical protein